MKATIRTSATGKGTADLKRQLAQLKKTRVLIGVPEDKTDRKDGAITNAQLLYIHTNGSPLRHIPARPVIEPAIQAPDNKKMITGQLGQAAKAVLDSKPKQAKGFLHRAGILGTNAAKRWFTDFRNGWPKNSAATIASKGSDRPLIDTAQLRRAITFVVEE